MFNVAEFIYKIIKVNWNLVAFLRFDGGWERQNTKALFNAKGLPNVEGLELLAFDRRTEILRPAQDKPNAQDTADLLFLANAFCRLAAITPFSPNGIEYFTGQDQ